MAVAYPYTYYVQTIPKRENPILTLLLTHAAATLYMTGLIWFVQIVHYPLAGQVGDTVFSAYQAGHMSRTAWVVIPPMLTELACAGLLVVARPEGVPAWSVWLGAALLALIWGSTALFQAPTHSALLTGPDPAKLSFLVTSNWLRTVGWSLRGGLAVAMIAWAWSAR